MLRLFLPGQKIKNGKEVGPTSPCAITAVPHTVSQDWSLLIQVSGAQFTQRMTPETQQKLQDFLEALEADQNHFG